MILDKPAKELWADYLFLSQELLKFVRTGDAEMVDMLLDQRDRLQKIIDTSRDKEFIASGEGKRVLAAVRETNAAVTREMYHFLSRGKQQQALEQAYAGGAAARPSGGFLNKKG